MSACVHPRGRCQRFFNAPAFAQPLAQRAIFDSRGGRPLRNSPAFAIEGQHGVSAPVVVLLADRCPSTIGRRVVAVVVDSVDGHAGRPFPHIGQECFESHPAVANRDASPAIAGEVRMAGVQASFLHCGPRFVRGRFKTGRRVPVSGIALSVPAMASLHISGSDLGDDTLALFFTKVASEDAVGVPEPRLGVAHKHKRVQACASSDDLTFGDSSHMNILPILGKPGKHYGQHEQKIERLRDAYVRAGGTLAGA